MMPSVATYQYEIRYSTEVRTDSLAEHETDSDGFPGRFPCVGDDDGFLDDSEWCDTVTSREHRTTRARGRGTDPIPKMNNPVIIPTTFSSDCPPFRSSQQTIACPNTMIPVAKSPQRAAPNLGTSNPETKGEIVLTS